MKKIWEHDERADELMILFSSQIYSRAVEMRTREKLFHSSRKPSQRQHTKLFSFLFSHHQRLPTLLRCGRAKQHENWTFPFASSALLATHPIILIPFHGKLSFWTLICCVMKKVLSFLLRFRLELRAHRVPKRGDSKALRCEIERF